MKYFVIFGLALLSLAWLGCNREPYYLYLAHKLRDQYIADVTRDGRFRLEAIGGAMADDIQKFNIGFGTVASPTVEQARVEFVTKAEEFLQRVNSWEEIRPYLHDYPATIKNFGLTLTFRSPSGRFSVGPETVAYVSTAYGTVFYSRDNPTTKRLRLEDIHSEPYEEALRIVRQQHLELLHSGGGTTST